MSRYSTSNVCPGWKMSRLSFRHLNSVVNIEPCVWEAELRSTELACSGAGSWTMVLDSDYLFLHSIQPPSFVAQNSSNNILIGSGGQRQARYHGSLF